MNKKTALISILIVFILLVGGLLYFYFTNTGSTPTTTDTTQNSSNSGYEPFGGGGTANTTVSTSTTHTTPATISRTPLAKIRKLTEEPVAGATFLSQKNKTLVRYIERATGHIYEADTDSEETRRVSNTTIPKVYTSVWNTDGKSLVMQYLKEDYETITSFAAKIILSGPATTTAEGAIQGVFLPENIRALVANPGKTKIAYLLYTNQGSTITTASFDGSDKKIVFSSPAREWLLDWPKENTLILTTKPSGQVSGFSYSLSLDTGNLTKVIDAVTGLTTLFNPSIDRVLVGDSARNTARLFVYDIKKNEYTNLNKNSLPEKCVWSKKDTTVVFCAIPKTIPSLLYPDSWYQGLVLFSDELWKMNTLTGTSERLFDLSAEGGESIDATNLSLDTNEQHLLFINKQNLSPWLVTLP